MKVVIYEVRFSIERIVRRMAGRIGPQMDSWLVQLENPNE